MAEATQGEVDVVSIDQIRLGLIDQFEFVFGLSKADARKAADELVGDEAFISNAKTAASKTVAIAQKFGWKKPT